MPDSSHTDAVIVKTLTETPSSGVNSIEVQDKRRYKYARFRQANKALSIAELTCLDSHHHVIPTTSIADDILMDMPDIAAICDGKPLTYIDLPLEDSWVGVAFQHPVSLSEIQFYPRTDDNAISIGDTYELFYWDNHWISLGQQVAAHSVLTYKDVPKNALLWLRNKTKGVEERPFTYENNKQIWW